MIDKIFSVSGFTFFCILCIFLLIQGGLRESGRDVIIGTNVSVSDSLALGDYVLHPIYNDFINISRNHSNRSVMSALLFEPLFMWVYYYLHISVYASLFFCDVFFSIVPSSLFLRFSWVVPFLIILYFLVVLVSFVFDFGVVVRRVFCFVLFTFKKVVYGV